MEKADLEERLAQLNTWSRGDQRAPDKPLMILYALGKLLAGKQRFMLFSDLEAPMTELLREFGPSR
jgi:putative restriction endonuclease